MSRQLKHSNRERPVEVMSDLESSESAGFNGGRIRRPTLGVAVSQPAIVLLLLILLVALLVRGIEVRISGVSILFGGQIGHSYKDATMRR